MKSGNTSGTRRDGLLRDESAQAMVVGVLSMFFLLPAVALVYNVSQMLNQRIAAQQAADAAAQSGALVEANMLSTVATGNEAMAYAYYGAMRHVVNVIVSGVLAEFKKRGASDDVVGVPGAEGKHRDAHAQASFWVPRSERWMRTLTQVNQSLASITPRLMAEEMAIAARAKGMDAASVYPTPRFWPNENDAYMRFFIDKVHGGWQITDDGQYVLGIESIGPSRWQVTKNTGMQYTFEKIGGDTWRVTLPYVLYELHTDGRSRLNVTIDRSAVGGPITLVKSRMIKDDLWRVQLVQGPLNITFEPLGNDTYKFTTRSFPNPPRSEVLRWDEFNRPMLLVNGRWQLHTRFPTEVTAPDGRVVPVVYDTRMFSFPGGVYEPPNKVTFREAGRSVTFDPPHTFPIPLPFSLTVQPGRVTLHDQHPPVQFRIWDDQVSFSIHGLTLQQADGRWRPIGPMSWHRIYQESATRWIYEYRRYGSFMTTDSLNRLGHHAVMDNDPDARPRGPNPMPPWTAWFVIGAGRSASDQAYYQTRPVWDASIPGQDYDGDGQLDVRICQGDIRGLVPPFQDVDLRGVAPLKLRPSFWIFGLNVMTWVPGKPPLLGHRGQGKQILPAFPPSSGFFGTASARAGFLHRYPCPCGPVEERMRFYFDSVEAAEQWSETGYQCLYEPTWVARLIPMVDSLRSEDIGALPPDTGISLLFRQLKANPWYDIDSPERFGDGTSQRRRDVEALFMNLPNRFGRRIHTDDPDLENSLDH